MNKEYDTKNFLEPALVKTEIEKTSKKPISKQDIVELKKLLRSNSQELWKYLHKKERSQVQK